MGLLNVVYGRDFEPMAEIFFCFTTNPYIQTPTTTGTTYTILTATTETTTTITTKQT